MSAERDEGTQYYAVMPSRLLELGPYHYTIYGVLRDFADHRSNEAWPSHATIAERVGISPRKVRTVLADLRDHGWVSWRQRKAPGGAMTSNVYTLHPAPYQPEGVRHEVPGVRHEVPGVRHEVPTPPAPGADELLPNELLPNELEEHPQTPDAGPVEPAALAQPATPAERARAEAFGFEHFWDTYPRRVGKRQAAKAWARAVKRADAADIIAAAGVFASDPNLPEPQYVPHPATWLNRDGWEDDPLPARNAQKPPSSAERMLTLATTLAAGEMPPEVAASAAKHPAYRNRHPVEPQNPFLQIVGGP